MKGYQPGLQRDIAALFPASPADGTFSPSPRHRPATVSTTPTRGPLGGQFPEEPRSEIDPFREFDTPEKRDLPPGFEGLPAWHTGTSIPDTAEGAEDAARGVSRAIRAAGTDMPDALL